ncbi:hypothetical protein [Nostoc sp.]
MYQVNIIEGSAIAYGGRVRHRTTICTVYKKSLILSLPNWII